MLTQKGTQTLETARLILRKAQVEDADAMFRNWASQPEVTRYLTWPTHSHVDVSRQILEFWAKESQKDNFYLWMIVLKELGQPIGSISVVRQNEDLQSVEIGYCLGKDWWHQGLMTEALTAVVDFFFRQVGVNRIEARHDPNNPHSGGVMRKCGMHYEGTSRQSDRNNQGICDAAHYAILRSDWEKAAD